MLTLLAVVLITVAVIAFFSSISSHRQIENSRAHGTQADQIARTAGDYIVGKFLEEISSPANSTTFTANGTTLYAPAASANAVPVRNISGGISVSDTDFSNLVRQSISSADANASGDSTLLPARNNRTVGFDQWNAPLLNVGAGFTAADQLPNWIYLDRIAGPTTGVSTNVIGRFAYNVYNIGGLLNINAAGYPHVISAGTLNGTIAGADLTNLPSVTQADVDALIAFRNPTTSTDATGYTTMATNSAGAGFLYATVTNAINPSDNYTNNFFNGRQDFLRYARTQDTDLTNAAPYLTTFSRSLNAPSWEPLADVGTYKYLSTATATASINRFIPSVTVAATTTNVTIPHWRDDGTLETTTPTVVQPPGGPLVQHRFSLAKLAWITHTGPAPGISASALQACFGLIWNGSNQTLASPVQSDPRWEYVGPTGSAVQYSIETLGQVAAEHTPREPNFFELLQAGILTGSLGQSGYASGQGGDPNIQGYETNRFYQIIRIGADIIDQARADNYPTAIEFSNFEFWGIKDLPYINKLIEYPYWPGQNPVLPTHPLSATPTPPVTYYLSFELWNPHQPSGIGGPTRFRIRVNKSAEYKYQYWDPTIHDWTSPDGDDLQSFVVPSNPLLFTADGTSAAAQTSYRDPHAIRTGGAPTVGGASAIQLMTDTTDSPVNNTLVPFNNCSLDFVDTVFIIEYYDPTTGSYRPYSTFQGQEEAGGVNGMYGNSAGDGPGMTAFNQDPGASASSIDTLPFLGSWPKTDPRTFRFDVQWGLGGVPNGQTGVDQSFRTVNNTYFSSSFNRPSFMSQDYTAVAAMARLASNNQGNVNHFYIDPDGVTRSGDSWFNDQNPYGPIGSEASQRPVILDRPLRSVAEMGYAYRDLPFKTLDFFSATSGDKGLLDLFTIVDEPAVSAGNVDLNLTPTLVRQSLLAGNTDAMNSTTLASDYQSFAMGNNQTPTANLPRTRAQLADFIYGNASLGSNPGAPGVNPSTFSSIDLKPAREGAVRALGGPVQTRTWNLLIDVVAQTGRFVGASTLGSNFVVEGEKHCWLSVAIDRYTGKIVDQQLEFVNE